MGQSVTLPPTQENQIQEKEHLNRDILQKLNVEGNKFIPLMIHQSSFNLLNYSKDKPKLKIEASVLPSHFLWTLEQLNLLNRYTKKDDLCEENKMTI